MVEFNDPESVKKFKNKEPRKNKKKTITLGDAVSVLEEKEKEKGVDEKKATDMMKKIKNKDNGKK